MNEESGYQAESTGKFNSMNDILQTVGYLKYKATEEYLKGNIPDCFYIWQQARVHIMGRMDDKTYYSFIDLERKVGFIINNLSKNPKYRFILARLNEAYIRKIQRTIEGWGMGTVNKEDRSVFA